MNKINGKYFYLDLEIQKVNNINIALNDKIDSYSEYIKEIEDKEEAITSLLDLLVATRTQANLLSLVVNSLSTYNRDFILNASRKPNEQINPIRDNAIKMDMLNFRY